MDSWNPKGSGCSFGSGYWKTLKLDGGVEGQGERERKRKRECVFSQRLRWQLLRNEQSFLWLRWQEILSWNLEQDCGVEEEKQAQACPRQEALVRGQAQCQARCAKVVLLKLETFYYGRMETNFIMNSHCSRKEHGSTTTCV